MCQHSSAPMRLPSRRAGLHFRANELLPLKYLDIRKRHTLRHHLLAWLCAGAEEGPRSSLWML